MSYRFFSFIFILFPFVSLPLGFGSYKPVVLVLISLAYIKSVLMFDRVLYSKEKYSLMLLVILTGYVLMQGLAFDNINSQFVKEFIAIFVAFTSFLGIYIFIRINGIHLFFRCLLFSLAAFMIFGFVELLSYFIGVKGEFNEVIGGRATSRFQLTTSEGSWGARLVIFYLPFSVYLLYKKQKYSSIIFFSLLLFLVLTFSIEVVLCVFVALFYYLISTSNNAKSALTSTLILIILTGVGWYFISSISLYWADSEFYFLARIHELLLSIKAGDWYSLLEIDESIFVRTIYPLVSMDVFRHNLAFGVGLGGYQEAFNNHIYTYLDYLIFDREVYEDIYNETGDPRFLIGKVFAMFGIFFGVMFTLFLIKTFKYALAISHSAFGQAVSFGYALTIVSIFQFGSFFYAPLIVFISMIHAMYDSSVVPSTHEYKDVT